MLTLLLMLKTLSQRLGINKNTHFIHVTIFSHFLPSTFTHAKDQPISVPDPHSILSAVFCLQRSLMLCLKRHCNITPASEITVFFSVLPYLFFSPQWHTSELSHNYTRHSMNWEFLFIHFYSFRFFIPISSFSLSLCFFLFYELTHIHTAISFVFIMFKLRASILFAATLHDVHITNIAFASIYIHIYRYIHYFYVSAFSFSFHSARAFVQSGFSCYGMQSSASCAVWAWQQKCC